MFRVKSIETHGINKNTKFYTSHAYTSQWEPMWPGTDRHEEHDLSWKLQWNDEDIYYIDM